MNPFPSSVGPKHSGVCYSQFSQSQRKKIHPEWDKGFTDDVNKVTCRCCIVNWQLDRIDLQDQQRRIAALESENALLRSEVQPQRLLRAQVKVLPPSAHEKNEAAQKKR